MIKITFVLLSFLLTSCRTSDIEYAKIALQCNDYFDCGSRVNSIYKKVNNKKKDEINSRYKPYNSLNEAIEDNNNDLFADEKYFLFNKPENYEGHYKIGEPYKIGGKKYYPKCDANYKEKGLASWYGEEFYGKRTANGEIYNMHDMTAAHPTLPLPSVVKITNLENGRTVKVRVNDRGPFIEKRIIDVSKEAAKRLGFVNEGVAKVKVEFLQEETELMLKNYKLK